MIPFRFSGFDARETRQTRNCVRPPNEPRSLTAMFFVALARRARMTPLADFWATSPVMWHERSGLLHVDQPFGYLRFSSQILPIHSVVRSGTIGALRVHRLNAASTNDALRPSSGRRCVAVTVSAFVAAGDEPGGGAFHVAGQDRNDGIHRNRGLPVDAVERAESQMFQPLRPILGCVRNRSHRPSFCRGHWRLSRRPRGVD
jgi:hypothetical protein